MFHKAKLLAIVFSSLTLIACNAEDIEEISSIIEERNNNEESGSEEGNSNEVESGSEETESGNEEESNEEEGNTSNAVSIPARIEAEDFVRYFDTTEENLGGGEGSVDVEETGDSAGGEYNIGYVDAGEWLEYDISSLSDTVVDITLRVASRTGDREIALFLDGLEYGRLSVPKTQNWQSYVDITLSNILITPNTDHQLRVEFVDGLVNLNYIDIVEVAVPGPVITPVPTEEPTPTPTPISTEEPTPTPTLTPTPVSTEEPVPTPTPVPTEEPIETVGSIEQGLADYDAMCAVCHGSDVEGSVISGGLFTPIDLSKDYTHSSTPDTSLAFIPYTVNYMPTANVNQCDTQCATNILAYLNSLTSNGEGNGEEGNAVLSAAPTPLSRLTNNEYIKSIRSLLNLSNDSPNIESALPLMAAESNVNGLTNDAEAQSYSTAFASGYVAVALAAADDFLDGINNLNALEELMQCDAFEAASTQNNYTSLNCFRDFSRNLIEQAYGRPFTDADEPSEYFESLETYVSQAGLNADSVEAYQFRLNSIIPYIFLSPEFLLFVENGEANVDSDDINARYLNSYEIAKRMSYFLTGTIPDDALMVAAEAGSLSNPEVRLEHANRLLNDDTVADQFADFFVGWLGVSTSVDQVEQSDVDLLKQFLADWFANDQPFSELYSGTVDVLNTDGSITPMNLGALGTKAFVASHTNNPVPSFINRGEFVTTQLLCGNLPDDIPLEAFEESSVVADNAVDLFHELPTHTCASCHLVMDNYGALFQQFEQETSLFDANLTPYGQSFDLASIGDISGVFDNLESFGQSLGDSQTAAQCASELLYRHSVRRSVDQNGEDDLALNAMFNEWINSGDTSIKSLLKVIIGSERFITLFQE